MRVESQQGYVLHTREYRDSSLLVELMSLQYGRVSAVAKGVRNANKSSRARRSAITPFAPLLLSWSGRGELKTLIQVESSASTVSLAAKSLFSGMYVNELMCRLLQYSEPQPEIFALYEWVLLSLSGSAELDITLRRFELGLLEALGYGFDYASDFVSGAPLVPERLYWLDCERGFTELSAITQSAGSEQRIFRGEHLIAIAEEAYSVDVRRSAKRLCRQALAVHLGSKPLKSRELFV
jgi:DNA repair protein RecO (recombination protein O)